MGKFEVTQGQWWSAMGTDICGQNDKSKFKGLVGEGPDHPMYQVVTRRRRSSPCG